VDADALSFILAVFVGVQLAAGHFASGPAEASGADRSVNLHAA